MNSSLRLLINPTFVKLSNSISNSSSQFRRMQPTQYSEQLNVNNVAGVSAGEHLQPASITSIELIYGPAGVGKTEAVINRLKELLKIKDANIAVLAPTHSAVQNLKNRCLKLLSEQAISHLFFATIYSYFRIDWLNDDVIGAITYHPYIFIDEFGLIKKELFQSILHKIALAPIKVNLVISGDIVQLSPIYEGERMISFRKLKKHYERVPAYIAEHDFNSIFSISKIRKSKHTLLTINHRSNRDVLEIINKLFFKCECDIKPITTMRAINLIMNEDWTMISSKYEFQRPIYDTIIKLTKNGFKVSSTGAFKELLFFEGARFIANDNYKDRDILNGDELVVEGKMLRKPDGELVEANELDLLPSFLLSAHKAQGLSIDKVIVCIDELFDPCLLYTACTRAVSNLEFYSTQRFDDKRRNELIEYLKRFNELMRFYGYVYDEIQ